jgi:hypothetical protein
MPETKLISTLTDITTSGSNISIRSYYQEDNILPDTILAYIENNDLFIKMKNSPDNIDYMIDSNGHLILTISTGDESNYDIDSNGHLIYTTNI